MSGSAFSPRSALVLVMAGAALLLALLWAAGQGLGDNLNDGGAHAGGKGLAGYAGLVQLLEANGYQITKGRSDGQFGQAGLLVLTPTFTTKGADIERIVEQHRKIGPVLVIAPKWAESSTLPPQQPGVKPGWVELGKPQTAPMEGFHDELKIGMPPMPSGGWHGMGLSGTLPYPKAVYTLSGPGLVAWVWGSDGRILAGQVLGEEDTQVAGDYPLYIVYEPDLLNNYGLARAENAALAEALIDRAASVNEDAAARHQITFDLTLNGLGRPLSPLTLAMSPPWLAATLCLLLAAFAAGWRSFLRFGPALAQGRSIAFGKRALVGSAGGLILRSRRSQLIAEPYVAAACERTARALGLPRGAPHEVTLAAIDRALAAKSDTAPQPFSDACARLAAARGPTAIVEAARRLHTLERMLTR